MWSGECGVRKAGLLGSLREPDYPNERRIGEDSVGGEVVIGLKDCEMLAQGAALG